MDNLWTFRTFFPEILFSFVQMGAAVPAMVGFLLVANGLLQLPIIKSFLKY